MSKQIILVPAEAPLPLEEGLEVLHTYRDGRRLARVEMTGPTVEAATGEATGFEEVETGLALPDADPAALERARHRLEAPLPEADARRPILAYVVLAGPVDPAWLEALRQHGVEPLRFQPRNSYLCRGSTEAFRTVAAQLPFVIDVTPLTRDIKPRPIIPEAGEQEVVISLTGLDGEGPDDRRLAALLDELSRLPGVTVDRQERVGVIGPNARIRATVNGDGLDRLMAHPLVERVDRFSPPTIEDEVADLILAGKTTSLGRPQGEYLAWLEQHGLNGQGVAIGIVDNGVDETHPAFSGRIRARDDGERAWHGTMVAGYAAGRYLEERDGGGFIYGLGVAPAAELVALYFSDVIQAPDRASRDTVNTPGPGGARATIQNNSWGQELRNPMDYGPLDADYDALVRNADPHGPEPRPLTICFSIGNRGDRGMTRPKAAKNIIVTGNSENFRPDVGRDESDNINEVYTGPDASSHGSNGDGRIRPHIVAPGEWTASASYNSPERYRVSDRITWGGGSSGASPKTAGACALLTQWWRRNNDGQDPSPALLRALLVNSAVDMGFGGPIPNMQQGWGRLNVANALDENLARIYVDQSILLREQGEARSWHIRIADPDKPLKVTLAWTDPPGPPGSGRTKHPPSPIVNRLALSVSTKGKSYRANNFEMGWSTDQLGPHPPREGNDNLQNVYLPAFRVGEAVTVTVTALDLTTDCLTLRPTPPQQDFALVITNAVLDGDETPADVTLVVDEDASGAPKPDDPGDFWDEADEQSNDDELLGSGWWDEVEDEQPGDDEADGDEEDDDWWWVDAWPEAGGDPEVESGSRPAEGVPGERLARHAAIVRGFEEGVTLLGAGDRVVTPDTGGPVVEGGAGAEADAAPGSRELSAALAALMADWNRQGDEGARRLPGVLVVGPGTRVTARDILALRRLAFLGDLYLLSDDQAVLNFLAQRIHMHRGIHYRLAAGPDELGLLLRSTLAEVGGAQRAAVRKLPDGDGGPARYRFHVATPDRRITAEIDHGLDAHPKIQLAPPGEEPFTVTPRTQRRGVAVTEAEGRQRVTIEAPEASDRPWAGSWHIVVHAPGRVAPVVRVWLHTALEIGVEERRVPVPESGADLPSGAGLLRVSGQEGAEIQMVRMQANMIGGKPMPEAGALPTMEARPPRAEVLRAASHDGPVPEARDVYHAPAVSTWLPVPTADTGATVMDITLAVSGQDGNEHPFYRFLHTNLIRLEPLDRWRRRRRRRPQRRIFLTPARVEEIVCADGAIAGLVLSRGSLRRVVRVRDARLRTQLGNLAEQLLREDGYHFGVRGEELISVVRLLDAGREPVADEARGEPQC